MSYSSHMLLDLIIIGIGLGQPFSDHVAVAHAYYYNL